MIKAPFTLVTTSLGVVVGGMVWLAVYASRAGVIEFDGPAGAGLLLALLVGGTVTGLVGIITDVHRGKKIPVTFSVYVTTLATVAMVVLLVLASYAQNRWGYKGAI